MSNTFLCIFQHFLTVVDRNPHTQTSLKLWITRRFLRKQQIFGTQNKTSLQYDGRMCTHLHYGDEPPMSNRVLLQLPSSRLSITRVSAQLLLRVLPYGKYSCRLLTHFWLLITDCSPPAPCGGRFPGFPLFSLCCRPVCRRPPDVSKKLLCIVCHIFCEQCIEDPDQFTSDCGE